MPTIVHLPSNAHTETDLINFIMRNMNPNVNIDITSILHNDQADMFLMYDKNTVYAFISGSLDREDPSVFHIDLFVTDDLSMMECKLHSYRKFINEYLADKGRYFITINSSTLRSQLYMNPFVNEEGFQMVGPYEYIRGPIPASDGHLKINRGS